MCFNCMVFGAHAAMNSLCCEIFSTVQNRTVLSLFLNCSVVNELSRMSFLVSWFIRIQMGALGHSSTPSCSICCQFFSFFPGNVAPPLSHRPNRLQEVHHASWAGVVSGGACLHVSWTAQEQMLCCLVVASASTSVLVHCHSNWDICQRNVENS